MAMNPKDVMLASGERQPTNRVNAKDIRVTSTPTSSGHRRRQFSHALLAAALATIGLKGTR